MSSTTHRYGPAWRALGITILLLFLVLPALMVANHEHIDVSVAVICACGIALGIWCFAYFARYRVTLNEDGVGVERFLRAPFYVAWRNVACVSTTDNELRIQASDGRVVKIATYFPGYSTVEQSLALRVPDAAYTDLNERPLVEPVATDPVVSETLYAARKTMWFSVARRCFYFALALLMIGWIAGAILDRADLRSLPPALAVAIAYILAWTRSFAYGFAAWLFFMAVASVVMTLQETYRHRNGLPPAV